MSKKTYYYEVDNDYALGGVTLHTTRASAMTEGKRLVEEGTQQSATVTKISVRTPATKDLIMRLFNRDGYCLDTEEVGTFKYAMTLSGVERLCFNHWSVETPIRLSTPDDKGDN